MKKLLVLCSLVVGLVAFSIVNADAYCIDFTSFCDRMEVGLDATGNLYGHWDWQCDNTFPKVVLGSKKGFNLVGDLMVETGAIWQFYFNNAAKLFDMYRYDGVNPPGLWINDSGYTLTAGDCLAPGKGQGLPKLTD